MNRIIKYLAAAVTGGLGAALITATSATAAPRPAGPAPTTGPVACTSASVWLKLQTSLGQRCYSGAGVEAVNDPGVTREQIIGLHEVCLRSNPFAPTIRCATGPATIVISPAVNVVGIAMV